MANYPGIYSSRDARHMMYEQGTRKIWTTVDTGSLIASGNVYPYNQDIQSARALFQLKRGLTQTPVGKWTVVASSGKAGGASLVALPEDTWFAPEDLVRGGWSATSDRSWIVLRSPTGRIGPFYFIMDWYSTASYVQPRVQWYVTRSCPDLSVLTTSDRPAATGPEVPIADSGVISTARVGGIRTYLVTAHDGSFVHAHIAIDNAPVNSHYFQYVTMLNVLKQGSYPAWDPVPVGFTRWGGLMNIDSTYSFRALHVDNSLCTLEPAHFGEGYSQSAQFGNHTDDITGKYPVIPTHLICTSTGAIAYRGILEDIYTGNIAMKDGTPVYNNGGLWGFKIGSFIVPSPRNLVTV